MTLLIAWIGKDQKKTGLTTASLYIGADSQYTWSNGDRYASGQKVFGSFKQPHIFGFCGDVTFAQQVILQLIQFIDFGGLMLKDNINDIIKILSNKIQDTLNQYPRIKLDGTTILHGLRFNDMSFHLIKYVVRKYQIYSEEVLLPNKSDIVVVAGSGKDDFENTFFEHGEKDNNYGTCRLMYHRLTEAIYSTTKSDVGGAPQIIGLYRKFNAIEFGIIKDDKRYLYGSLYEDGIDDLSKIEWRNDNFERVNVKTMKLKDGAQHQPF